MSNFDALCKKMEAKTYDEKVQIINDLTPGIIGALNSISEDGQSGINIYINFILAAIAADGKLAKEEFDLMKPIFEAAAGRELTYEEGLEIFKASGMDNPEKLKKTADLMLDLIGVLSEDLKNAIVILCLLVCAIDGEISKEEKDWIVQLVDDNFGLTPMEQVDAILDDAKIFTLATIDEGKPRMRVLGFKTMMDGKIYFAIGTFKDVYKQIVANPNVEILGSAGAQFVRWNGKAVFSDDARLGEAFARALPEIDKLYKSMGATLAYFTIEDGTAEIVGADNTKKKLF